MRPRRWTAIGLVVVGCTLMSIPNVTAHARSQMAAPVGMAAEAIQVAVRLQPPPRTFTIAATGDVLNEDAVNNAARGWAMAGERFDFAPIFAPVAPILEAADLAICHMEIPIGAPGQRPGVYGRSPYGGNLILAPYEIAAGLRAVGYDRCSTASNHSNDLGPVGIATTLDALDAAGLTHVGTARSPEGSSITTFDVNGVSVAHLSYTRYSNTAATDPWRVNFASSVQQVVAAIGVARTLGAEVVIVSVHLSQELLRGPTPDDRAFITAVIAAAHPDLVIHHGPHVIQPLELVNGTWVYWSVGNFVSGMGWRQAGRYADLRTLDGLIATARFTETAPGQFAVDPTPVLLCNEHTSRTVYPVVVTLENPTISAELRAQLEQCLARSLPVVPDLR